MIIFLFHFSPFLCPRYARISRKIQKLLFNMDLNWLKKRTLHLFDILAFNSLSTASSKSYTLWICCHYKSILSMAVISETLISRSPTDIYYIYVWSFCGFTIDSYIIEICNLIIFLFFHLFTHRFVQRFGCSIGNVKSYIIYM